MVNDIKDPILKYYETAFSFVYFSNVMSFQDVADNYCPRFPFFIVWITMISLEIY